MEVCGTATGGLLRAFILACSGARGARMLSVTGMVHALVLRYLHLRALIHSSGTAWDDWHVARVRAGRAQ
eukprot:4152777-Alexandrium_andersonii.AAC.1